MTPLQVLVAKIGSLVKNAKMDISLGAAGEEDIQFDKGDGPITILGPNDTSRFHSTLRELLDLIPDSEGTNASDQVDDLLRLLISDAKHGKVSIGEGSLQQVLSTVGLEKATEWLVLIPISGVSTDSEEPITLGPFTIYKLPGHLPQVLAWSEHQAMVPHIQDALADHGIYVAFTLVARGSDAARIRAGPSFTRFESAMRFLQQLLTPYAHIGVINLRPPSFLKTIALNRKSEVSSASEAKWPVVPISLDKPGRYHGSTLSQWVWDSFSRKDFTEIDRRIWLAIRWFGSAIADMNVETALVQAMFGLEAILMKQEKGAITPSIMAQLAEWTSHLIGVNTDERLWIDGEVRRLYHLRSGLAHSGKSTIEKDDLLSALVILHRVVERLATDEGLRQLGSMEGLEGWIRGRRYTCPEDLPSERRLPQRM